MSTNDTYLGDAGENHEIADFDGGNDVFIGFGGNDSFVSGGGDDFVVGGTKRLIYSLISPCNPTKPISSVFI